MQANRSRDTGPERRLRSALWRLGVRFRAHARPVPDIPVRADVVIGRARIAVFVDGCFWHGCPIHGSMPASHARYWRAKIRGNRERDRRARSLLRRRGWRVVRVWEHEDPEAAAWRVARAAGVSCAARG
jgi:DNA mismatch endonuclease (patch repair protein)